MTKTIVLGNEYDDNLRSILAGVMRDLGAKRSVLIGRSLALKN
ncbi:hypothetical protein [Bradyrhizobium sp. USDA 10063]